jgi:hypothetical protein
MTSITATVPSANPIAVLLQWPGLASRPTGSRSVSPTKAAPATNRQRVDQAVQRAEPGDRPAAGLQVVPGVEVQRAEALRGDACGGRIALPKRDGGADGGSEYRAEDLLAERTGPEAQFQQRGSDEDTRDEPVTLSLIAETQPHVVNVILVRRLVIGQSDDAGARRNRPVARREDRPSRR